MDDREKMSNLMKDVNRLCGDAELPSAMLLAVLEAVKFEILSASMRAAEQMEMKSKEQHPVKVKVE